MAVGILLACLSRMAYSIGENAFSECGSINSITLPETITSIGYAAFYRCGELSSVTVRSITPPSVWSNSFKETHANLVIYVPAESVDTYKSASGWSDYASRIQAIQS